MDQGLGSGQAAPESFSRIFSALLGKRFNLVWDWRGKRGSEGNNEHRSVAYENRSGCRNRANAVLEVTEFSFFLGN
jgi:hypothetical protein